MSSVSERSNKVRAEARSRPDVIWRDQAGEYVERVQAQATPQSSVLTGGTELAQLVAGADAHLVAMRKIVQ